jgi:molybdenum cofactor cytidylyltransferase
VRWQAKRDTALGNRVAESKVLRHPKAPSPLRSAGAVQKNNGGSGFSCIRKSERNLPLTAAKRNSAFGVIILGAGASSRMGRPKLLLPWRDTTVIGHLLQQWRELGAAQIGIVLRPQDASLAAELDRLCFPRADRIENPQPDRGMFSSILCAANWPGWKDEITTWAVVLGDQPHLRLETLRQLLEFHFANANAVCQLEFDGHARHPVLLPRRAFNELKVSQAKTLKGFLKRTSVRSAQYSVDEPGLALDLNTPEDYQRAQDSIARLTPQPK